MKSQAYVRTCAVVPAEYWALSCLHPYVISSPLPDNTSVSLTRRLVGMFWGLAQANMFVCLSQCFVTMFAYLCVDTG